MTRDDIDEILLNVTTNIWCKRFPDLSRKLVRSNCNSALNLIMPGLMNAQVLGMTGEINECTNWYEVRIP